MKYIITEERIDFIIKKYLKGLLNIESIDDFYYSFTDYNCGMGVCCDPYSAGFYRTNIDEIDYPLFRLTDSKFYDDYGDYPEYLSDELPKECEEKPKIGERNFDTYIIENEDFIESLNGMFTSPEMWQEPLLRILNELFGTYATDILLRGYDI